MTKAVGVGLVERPTVAAAAADDDDDDGDDVDDDVAGVYRRVIKAPSSVE